MRNLRRLTQLRLVLDALFASAPPPAPGAVPGDEFGRPSEAASPEQSPPPRSDGPEFWCMNSGSAMLRGPPLTGSRLVVSPEPMITHPRPSIALVKKSPRRRSSPVATHVVPDWQMLPSFEIGEPFASAVKICGEFVSAPMTLALIACRSAFWHARSARLFVWYQTTLTLPLSPGVPHGQTGRGRAGGATVMGAFQCARRWGD